MNLRLLQITDSALPIGGYTHNLLAADILVNEGLTYAVQFSHATPGATYYVEVLAANPSGAQNIRWSSQPMKRSWLP